MRMISPATPPARGPRRWLYIALGCFFVGLGTLGVFLPVLPTTPFILLASFFFVRSSARLHAWLLRSRLFGPFLRDWHQHRAVRPHVKLTAFAMIPAVVTASAVFGELSGPVLAILIVLGLIGLGVVWRLPTVQNEAAAIMDESSSCPAGAAEGASR